MIEGTMKPSKQAAVLDKYIKQFLKWALKLSLDDKLALVNFMRTVRAAHQAGQEAEVDTPAEVPTPEPEPKLILPGLGGGSFIAHQEATPGATYGGLDAMLKDGRKPS